MGLRCWAEKMCHESILPVTGTESGDATVARPGVALLCDSKLGMFAKVGLYGIYLSGPGRCAGKSESMRLGKWSLRAPCLQRVSCGKQANGAPSR